MMREPEHRQVFSPLPPMGARGETEAELASV
jgi:hypothetical protein